MKMQITASTIVLVVVLAAPATAQNAKAIVDAENAKWVQAYNKGDAASLTALYAKDAVIIAATTPQPVIGSEAIRKYYDGEVAHKLSGLTLTQMETRALGPNALLDAGVWAGDVPDQKGGKPTRLTGPYVVTFVHQGSDWLLQTDASSLPPSPQ